MKESGQVFMKSNVVTKHLLKLLKSCDAFSADQQLETRMAWNFVLF